jgi:hypothetical protein
VLVNLRLGENALDVKSAHVLARLLVGNQTLTSLDLRDNALGDEGAALLGAALRRNAGLQCLVLWNNGIQQVGVAGFAEAFMAKAAAAEEVPNATLQILDLGSNVVGRDGADALKNVLVRQAAPLHTLGLADTALGEEGGIAIAEALEGNGWLQRVDLRRNRLGLAGLMALQLSMRTNEAVREMALDAVEPSADNREVQVQFQAEILEACRLNVARDGGAASASTTAATSGALQMMSELSFSAPLPPAAPATAPASAPAAATATATMAPAAAAAAAAVAAADTAAAAGGSATLIGTLNCLGDAYNPFEFMCDEAGFQAAYARLHEAAVGLSWEQFAEGCGEELLACPGVNAGATQAVARLKAHCDGGAPLWKFFDEATLAKDNRLVAPRLNLLSFALRPHGGMGGDTGHGARPAWEMCAQWRREMLALGTEDTCAAPYAADPNLWLWDLACNVVAARAPAEHASVCTGSHLNSANFDRLGARFAERAAAAAAGRPIVLGLQEWPAAASPKGAAFAAAFARHGLSVVCAPAREGGAGDASVALAYSEGAMGRPQLLDTSRSREAAQRAIELAAAAGHVLDAAASKALLDTTARKVLAVRFPAAAAAGAAATSFVVVHAKEPKTAAAATACALFLLELGASVGGGGGGGGGGGVVGPPPMVALLDANLSSAPLCDAFAAPLAERSLASEPPPSVDTTSKQRSLLHGQCYDASKCMRLVRAPKDKLVAPAGALSEVATFPRVAELSSGLPSPQWASDHALTTALLTHPPGPAERV